VSTPAERVVQALMRHPELLLAVRARLRDVRVCGPWESTEGRFGPNVSGLVRHPAWPSKIPSKVWVATIRPTEEWGDDTGRDNPGMWYWNVDVGRKPENGGGVVETRDQAARHAEHHLGQLGWLILPSTPGTVMP